MTGVSAGPYMRNLGTPYKIGFQPQGVRNDRTEEYMEARRAVEAGREVEEGRLSRRWAKVWMFLLNFRKYAHTRNNPSLSIYISTQLYLKQQLQQ